MRHLVISTILTLLILGGIGQVGALSCTYSAEIPTNGSSISDRTPTVKITPNCDETALNLTLVIDGIEIGLITGTNGSVNQWTNVTALSYVGHTWAVTATSGIQSSLSGTYTFTISRFGEAGASISAVTNDLIDPIANLVIGLIKLFVALFVISMIGSIFKGIGARVERRL